jgi:Tfp pilus assembly protein PilF
MARRRKRGSRDPRRSEETGNVEQGDLLRPDEEQDDDPPRRESIRLDRRGVVFELVEDPSRPEGPATAADRLDRAKELVENRRIDEASQLYRAILTDNPGSLGARIGLGALFEALGQHGLALEQFEAAVKLEPENVEVLNNLGSVLGALGRYEEGEGFLRRAARLAPDSADVRANLGILFFRKGLYAQAEGELRWACEQDQRHGNAFFYRGEALNRLGRFDDAMRALEQAIRLQPTNGKAFYTLGILYDRKHLPEEASIMYRKAREFLKA